MREVYRSAITPYPATAMYDLVADIESYHEFLPWCNESTVLSSTDVGAEQEVIASLGLALGPLNGRFTTCNRGLRPARITLALVDGPFSELEGEWLFQPLGDDGSKLELRMGFAFSNPVKDKLLGIVFEQTCNTLVDAFVTRAGVVCV